LCGSPPVTEDALIISSAGTTIIPEVTASATATVGTSTYASADNMDKIISPNAVNSTASALTTAVGTGMRKSI